MCACVFNMSQAAFMCIFFKVYLMRVVHRHTMSLHIAFEKSADTLLKKLVKVICGPYVHTELILTQISTQVVPEVHTGYTAFMNESFTRIFQKDFWYDDECHDFLHVPMSEEELLKVGKTCEACVNSKVPYNSVDMVLSQLPLRNPTERDIYDSKALFCSQAVVLVLRSCLDASHPLQSPLSTVNSRVISPSSLYNLLKPYCPRRTKTQTFARSSAQSL